ncbi:Butirosin biosynthesis protein H, N-terminal [Anaerocolumna jejuensis DSM 15929]|uniref:Butirosin biosynthesis protein H, N-terminal n=1 Tax=Anaerocolumna jejuensis DSM 15929 TaxID=1121322 RepID=A0A1M6Q7Q5_9FIRM|nr:BtrH N-terminal domain-containing protein [Anaerocolumna jejuensis]SHK16188.1 Butirosin biosynthesis protein H, N-terminal [Anaerocolumna jejuensis DSM 15929]
MSKRLIEIKHHLCDGCCMWSGIEDIYVTKTGEEVPEAFFFALSSYGENIYLKFHDLPRPVMLSVCDGRTRKTYEKIKEELGLQYKISEGRTLEYAFKSVKSEIDNGRPVILGPLDMYHLPYLKMYHKVHIPMHYVLMAGYDEKCIFLYDCGRKDIQTLSYEELQKAWQIDKNEVGNKNGFIRFSLPDNLPGVFELAKACFKRKANEQLRIKPEFAGISALRKIAFDFPKWKEEMPQDVYRNALVGLTEFLGMVPKIPDRLLGIQSDTEDIPYKGNCDRFGKVLILLGDKYKWEDWVSAGDLFMQSGEVFEKITSYIVSYLCDGKETLELIPKLFSEIVDLEESAYKLLL